MTDALTEAIRILGSQSAVAKACGGKVKQQHISWWLNKSRRKVPSQYAPLIAAACIAKEPSCGVTRERLCPDFPWEPFTSHDRHGIQDRRAGKAA